MAKTKDSKDSKGLVNLGGRPTKYTPELIDDILNQIACTDKGLHDLCKLNDGWPVPSTIFEWLIKYPEFADRYEKAKEHQQKVCIDQIKKIASDRSRDFYINEKGVELPNATSVARDKLIIDTLKWEASKLAPRVYGDKVQQEITVGRHEDWLKKLE